MTANDTQVDRPAGAGANSGTGTAWASTSSITSSNGVKATASLGSTAQSQNLDATGFGFSIPSTATITGIRVEIERSANGTSIDDEDVYILKAGAATGTDHASGTDWPTAGDASAYYGNSSDLWGTTWTPAQINASNFGVRLKTDSDTTSSRVASVDYIEIRVYYTPLPDTSIGTSGTGVAEAAIAGDCTYGSQAAHTPCSSADKVYSGNINQSPQGLTGF